jgi:DGQHR domain-containing protein
MAKSMEIKMEISFGHANVVNIKGTVADVYQAAFNYCSANGTTAFYGTVGEQMGRGVFSTSMLMREFLNFTREAPIDASKGADYARVEDFDHITQRAKDPKHVQEIADYIRACVSTDIPIVVPGVVLNCDQPDVAMFVLEGTNKRQFAAICINEDMLLRLIDGMHRKYAANEVLNPKKAGDRLTGEAEKVIKNLLIPAMVTFEENYSQLRDDFAVIAKAKEIAAGVQIAFRRNMINDFTAELLKATPFMQYHTSLAATQTGAKSAHAWSFSVVGRAMRRTVTGRRSNDESALSAALEKAREEQPVAKSDFGFDAFAKAWWTAVQNSVPVYAEMASIPRAPANYMADLRAKPNGENLILLNIGGLEVFAALGHDLWKNGWRTQADIDQRAAFIKAYDWSGSNPIWITNLIPFDGASVTQKDAAVSDAIFKVLTACYKVEKRPPLPLKAVA